MLGDVAALKPPGDHLSLVMDSSSPQPLPSSGRFSRTGSKCLAVQRFTDWHRSEQGDVADFVVKDDTEAPLRLEFAVVLRERAGSEGDFTGKRQTSPRSGCKNHSSAKASLAGSASCEKSNLPRDSSAHFSSKYSTFAPLGCLGFSPRECCGIFRGARQGQCNPGTELLFGNPRLLPDLGRGCCSGFAMRFTSAFPALSVWIWV